MLGGQLVRVTDWRGPFGFLSAVGILILVATGLVYRETLPLLQRTTGGLTQTGRDFRVLLSNGRFVGAVPVQGLVYAAPFAYLSGATYVLHGIYALSPSPLHRRPRSRWRTTRTSPGPPPHCWAWPGSLGVAAYVLLSRARTLTRAPTLHAVEPALATVRTH